MKKTSVLVFPIVSICIFLVGLTLCSCQSNVISEKDILSQIQEIYQTNRTDESFVNLEMKEDELNQEINSAFQKNTQVIIEEISETFATVKISAPDLSGVINQLLQQDFSGKSTREITQYCKSEILRALNEGGWTRTEKTVRMDISRENGETQIVYNEDFFYAAYPGLYDFLVGQTGEN